MSRFFDVRAFSIGALAVAIIAVMGGGIAAASNGGSLILGHTNTESATTILKDTTGSPLDLEGTSSKSPLRVNSTKQVADLNSSLLQGYSASSLATDGSHGSYYTEGGVTIPTHTIAPYEGKLVVATAPLAAGTYFVTASATTATTALDDTFGTYCFIGLNTTLNNGIGSAVSNAGGYAPLSETGAVTVAANAVLGEYCYTVNSAAKVYQASITAIRILHSTTGTDVYTP